MRLSGFTFVRNAGKYYFPVKESIQSILPVVDEFIVALGDSDPDDNTKELIESISSDKIKVFERKWSESDFVDGRIFANETNFALGKCNGDFCFHLQSDEVVHEKDLDKIVAACKEFFPDERVAGLLFKYYHFWGDYNHYLPFHGWYKNEIRIIRNHSNIHSFKDSQSFRKGNDGKLTVKEIDAHIYHYSWVKPPHLMQRKKKEQDSMYHGREETDIEYKLKEEEFDFGALGMIPAFNGSHPKVMSSLIQNMNWSHKLNYSKKAKLNRQKFKHEKLKYRVLTFIEKIFFGGKEIFGHSNWKKM